MGANTVELIRGLALLGLVVLAACDNEEILPGERLDPRAVIEGAYQPPPANSAPPLALPAAQQNANWPQRGGGAQHLLVNPAIGGGVTEVWSAPIGEGESYRYRLVSEPVVANGVVYTLDSRGTVTATSTANGGRLWQADVTPPGDRSSDASGSGLAYDNGRLFVTSNYAELVALDGRTGGELWRKPFDAGIGGAPTVSNGLVFVVARDASAWALRAEDGKVEWLMNSAPATLGTGGASAPVVAGKAVIFPFATGHLTALLAGNGLTLWDADVAGRRTGRGYTMVQDLTGEPVVSGDVVYAGSTAGKLSAFNLGTGQKLWTASEGANAPAQVAGGSVFITTDNAKLQRLNAATGERIWSVDLPNYVEEKPKNQNQIYVNYGPVLAGGKLFVPCSDGVLRVFDPVSGKLIGQGAIPGGASTDPVVAGGTLYVVSREGVLHAYR